MQVPSVFGYMKFSHYLSDRFRFEKQINPAFSHRYFVRVSGIRSQSLLSMIASGKRLPTPDMLHSLCKGLKLKSKEKEYLTLIVDYERAQGHELKVNLIHKINELNPNASGDKLSLEQFATASSWYHIAILEMTYLKGFHADAKWIVEHLHRKITVSQADEALERLVALGLLSRNGDQTVKTQKTLHIGDEVRSVAIRDYHRQVLELAGQAIEGQAMEERLLTGATLCMSKTQLQEIYDVLSETIRKVARKYHTTQGDQVYQLGLQFFKLTK